ncbi:MFS transporter [Ciceribacter sp. L1K22]|uniref:MFS transporter n=1 Tax=Ciceribacter sp. L1K22 TaxID=2820275 RepID=UPI001ABE513E|nr:MFS transporter [Ciceribacter sp. L1K22]MBO3761292.1 MFS transporter [Ciceribacter sp. L1K22]
MSDQAFDRALQERARLFPRPRVAVATLFLLNGFVMGSWAPKIPEFAGRLALSEADLGLMLLAFGVGSVLLMPLAGAQIARLGSNRVVQVATLLFIPTILGVTFAPSIWSGAMAIFLFGGLTGAMDVSMNANAVEVERRMGRSIMSSCHAFWSLGGLLGSSIGGYLIAAAGVSLHAVMVSSTSLALFLIARPMILKDAPHLEEVSTRARLPISPLPWLIGIIALFSMIPEGTILDWGAIYLRDELSADIGLSGLAFAAFSLTMAIMRFMGDWVRDRLGAVRTLRICSVLSFSGLVVAGLAPNVFVALLGFGIAGVGISNMVPIAFSAAGNAPGMAAGVGLSVVTTLGYSGILFAPSLIGFVAEHTSLSIVFTGVSMLNIVVLGLSNLARHADRPVDHVR